MQRAPLPQAAARQRGARQDPSLCEKGWQFLTYEFPYVRLGVRQAKRTIVTRMGRDLLAGLGVAW